MAQVRLELAEEELRNSEAGIISSHDVSVNVFLQIGLELEEQQ